MIDGIVGIVTLLTISALGVVGAQAAYYIPKVYRLEAYKVAERAANKYLDSRFLVGIQDQSVAKIANDLDEYLNDVIGVDLEPDELMCFVESRMYKIRVDADRIDKITDSVYSVSTSLSDMVDSLFVSPCGVQRVGFDDVSPSDGLHEDTIDDNFDGEYENMDISDMVGDNDE